jgi:broad specificity phosphatase PhoE
MGHLYLVRHAQASFFGASYDDLSALGRAQARALGEHWAQHAVDFEAVYVGPRRRHRQTCDIVASVYRERALPFPEATALPELDEHQGLAVIKHRLGRDDAAGEALQPAETPDGERELALRGFLRHYNEAMREWARGRVHVPGVETWDEFRARSLRALDLLCAGTGRGRRVAFTSGGLVSSAAGWLLGLDSERIIDLSIVLRNTALTEISWSARRRSLVSFNSLPHLPDPRAATSV